MLQIETTLQISISADIPAFVRMMILQVLGSIGERFCAIRTVSFSLQMLGDRFSMLTMFLDVTLQDSIRAGGDYRASTF